MKDETENKGKPVITEYDLQLARAESAAIEAGGMTSAAVRISRVAAIRLLASIGITPERVWMLTRRMRKEA